MKYAIFPLAALGLLSWAGAALAADGTVWQMSTGMDYSTGKYGAATDTTVYSIPLELRAQANRLRLDLSIPYLNVRGPGNFTGGVVVGGSNPVTSRSGIGDLNVGAAWLLNRDGDFPAIEIGTTIKVPTAATNLGTGKPDYTAMANLYHSFTPAVMLFGTAGYQWLNNYRTYVLKDGVMASLGLNYKTSDTVSVGLSGSYRAEYYAGLGPQEALSPYLLFNFARNWRFTGYGNFGFSQASARIGGGIRLIYSE